MDLLPRSLCRLLFGLCHHPKEWAHQCHWCTCQHHLLRMYLLQENKASHPGTEPISVLPFQQLTPCEECLQTKCNRGLWAREEDSCSWGVQVSSIAEAHVSQGNGDLCRWASLVENWATFLCLHKECTHYISCHRVQTQWCWMRFVCC